MTTKTLSSALAVLLIASLVTPAALLLAPQRARAQAYTGCIGGLVAALAPSLATALGSQAAEKPIAVPVQSLGLDGSTNAGNITNGFTAGASWSSCINQFVIGPLIRAAIHALIQKLTATVINWIVNGGTNGTGSPAYVQNLSGHVQNVGDTQALAFLNQMNVATNFNSPFTRALTTSLAAAYLAHATTNGFFGANKDTLINVTGGTQQNEKNYLTGTWSQGGVSAWFALTTQNQNNPYILYQSSQNQLGSLASNAQSTRLNELNWGKGFLSWCGPANANGPGGGNKGTGVGNTCTNKDGSAGTTQTPGTIIAGFANQSVVAAPFGQLISSTDIDNALTSIINVLIGQVLGGVGGLLGTAQGTGGANLITGQLQTYANNSSSTPPSGLSPIAANQLLQTITARITQYQNSWSTIAATVNTASTALNNLSNSCAAQSAAAQAALTTYISPLFTQDTTAVNNANAAQSFAQQVQNEINSNNQAYVTDIQTLGGMPPSDSDAASAQLQAQTTGSATANPTGSLNVSGGTITDQMILLNANATVLQATCQQQ